MLPCVLPKKLAIFENALPSCVDSLPKNWLNTPAESLADLDALSTFTLPAAPALNLFCSAYALRKTSAESFADLVNFSCLRIASSIQLKPVENLSTCFLKSLNTDVRFVATEVVLATCFSKAATSLVVAANDSDANLVSLLPYASKRSILSLIVFARDLLSAVNS